MVFLFHSTGSQYYIYGIATNASWKAVNSYNSLKQNILYAAKHHFQESNSSNTEFVTKTFASLFIFLIFARLTASSQVCTNLGQTPATAFPVCGTDIFAQSSVPECSNHNIPTFCDPVQNVLYSDLNPYWYKFTCFQSGTLGFLIKPNNQEDDYDWQLFDVTGKNVNDVYSDKTTIVSYNWSGEHGNTGASNAGSSAFVCATINNEYRPLFSTMPNIIEGHQYLLLISHFLGDQQSGYQLSFGGGTGSITDLKDPALLAVNTNCDFTQLRLKLNKKMKCPSLAPDGSDFTLSAPGVTVTGAVAASCSGGFDMDSVIISLSGPLLPGNYTLTAVNGTDGNTLKDNCDRTVPVGSGLDFTILPLLPTPLDSIVPVKCAPSALQLVFKKPIQCSSIATDGSDFTVTGPEAVTVVNASGNCTGGLSSVITLALASPVYKAGNYQVHIAPGADGNTIIDECGLETLSGQSVSFRATDTVSADFSYSIAMGCKQDTIYYSHNGNNGVTNWTWVFDENETVYTQNHTKSYPATGEHTAQLTVTNGVCSATASVQVILNNEVTADFETQDIICPEDSATFINNSKGPIDNWSWTFGDGHISSLQNPLAEHYPVTGKEKYYTVGLTVNSPVGCTETVSKTLRVLSSCYIAVPSAFTPNSDGINDYLYPLNALKADHLVFRVYNRWGQIIFHTNDWQTKWDGTVNGVPQATGVYVWILQYTNHDSGKQVEMKGTSTLIR